MGDKLWYEDWEYETYTAMENQQYNCKFTIPNVKAGPKEIVVTDPVVAGLLMSALDWITKNDPQPTDS